MLSSPTIIEVVADRVAAWGITNLVVDPVMVAKSGDRLLHGSAVVTLRDKLLPIALIVTPNIPEAEVLAGITIATENDRQEAARIISATGTRCMLSSKADIATAILLISFLTAKPSRLIEGKRIDTQNTHGTGCTFSAAITANLALGQTPFESISAAKHYLTRRARNRAIKSAKDIRQSTTFPISGPSQSPAYQGEAS